jgi:competence protein ComEA
VGEEGLSFRRRSAATASPSPRWLLVLLVLALLLYGLTRPWRAPALPDGVLVEVQGDVPGAGTHLVEPPTLAAAVAAAGGDPAGHPDTPLQPGVRVIVEGSSARVEPATDPLLVALPIDLNQADARAIEAIPGVGAHLASAIVEDRQERGPFRDLRSVKRVSGVGEHTLELLAPFVKLSPAPPVDINQASAARLETLPGIGPVTAARIVVERDDGGPFAELADLQRVQGIGAATVAGLEGLAVAGAP